MAITATNWTWRRQATGQPVGTSLGDWVGVFTESNVDATFWTKVKNGGGDIRVCLDSDGVNELPIHVILCNTTTQKLVLRVRWSTYPTSGAVAYIFAGNPSASGYSVSDPFGQYAVYSSLVSNDYPLFDLTDSTSAQKTLTNTGSTPQTTGPLGYTDAYDFNGSSQYLRNASWSRIPDDFFVSFWYRSDNTSTTKCIISQGDLTLSQWDSVLTRNGVNYEINRASSGNNGGTIRTTWTMVHARFLGGSNAIYENGTFVGNNSQSAPSANTSFPDMIIGALARSGSLLHFDGAISGVRWFNGTPSNFATYSLVDYSNQSNPGTFWTMGAVDDPSGGGGGFTLNIESGTYTLTGSNQPLLKGSLITQDSGAYSLSGQNMILSKGSLLEIDSGSYFLSGQNNTLESNRFISLESGSYTINGEALNLLRGRNLQIDSGVYVLSGTTVDLIYSAESGFFLNIDSGTYNLNGVNLSLESQRIIELSSDSYSLSGQDIGTIAYRVLFTESGSYLLSGQNLGVFSSRNLQLLSGDYSLTGTDVNFTKGFGINLDNGSYIYSGDNFNLAASRNLSLDSGVYVFSGQQVQLIWSGLIIKRVSGYTVNFASSPVKGINFEQDWIKIDYGNIQ